MSTYRNKCVVGGFLQGSIAGGLKRAELSIACSIVCSDYGYPNLFLFTGQELWCLVKENLSRLALDTGLGLESSQLASLPASKLIVRSEVLITNSCDTLQCS